MLVWSVTRAAAVHQGGIAGMQRLCEPDGYGQSIQCRADISMTDLGDSLERMGFMQLLLLFGFVTAYVVALGGMLNVPLRQRAALLALLLAAAFVTMTDPWVNGALLIIFVVAGLGLFVMLSWLLARLLGPRELPVDVEAETALPSPTQPDSLPAPMRPDDSIGHVPKGARRARAAR
jgi:hypothetical protein